MEADLLVEALPDAILTVDAEGRIVRMNTRVEALFGYRREELLGQRVECLIPERFRELHVQQRAGYVAAPRLRPMGSGLRLCIRRKDGTELPVDIMLNPLTTAGGRLVIATIRDITEGQRQAEEILRMVEARIWMAGSHRRCTYFNPTWLAYTGRTLEEELEYGWVADVHPDDRAHCQSAYAAAFDARIPFTVEYRLKRYDGVYRWFLDKGGPHYLRDGTFAGYIGCCIDITERKQTEVELKRSIDELEQFAYVASHDLQEPLRAVAGCVGLLQQRCRGKLDAHAEELITHAIVGAQRLQTLIQDLLTFSRVGRRDKPRTPTDCTKVLQQVLTNLKAVIDDSGAVVTYDNLPMVTVEPTQMLQLLQNLLSNALKFRSNHPPAIHIQAQGSHSEWLFSVRDNGIGIEPPLEDAEDPR